MYVVDYYQIQFDLAVEVIGSPMKEILTRLVFRSIFLKNLNPFRAGQTNKQQLVELHVR